MSDTRTESDSLGDIEVPSSAYYGAQTERARQNFPVSGLRFPRRFIEALGMVKGEAAVVNEALGVLDADLATAIRQAADEVAKGERDGESVKVPRSIRLACYALAHGITDYHGPRPETEG